MTGLKESLSSSSIGGFRYIFNSHENKIARIYWTCAFLFSFGSLCFVARGLYHKWKVDPPYVAKVNWVPIHEIPFPAVTVCSPLYAKDEMANFIKFDDDVQKNGYKNLRYTNSQMNLMSAAAHACDPYTSTQILRAFPTLNMSYNIVQLLDQISPKVSEIFSVCLFRGLNVDCERIFKKVLTDAGFCYTFNIQDHHKIFTSNISRDFDSYKGEKLFFVDNSTTKASKRNVLNFVLSIKNSDLFNTCVKFGKGWKILFHQIDEMPTPFVDEYFIPFNRKRDMTITARVTRWEDAAYAYKPVQRAVYFPNERNLKFFKPYTKSHCDYENLANFVLRDCGCVKFAMPRFNDTPVCNLSRAICYADAIREWPYIDLERNEKSLMPYDCFPAADFIYYSLKMDQTGEFEPKSFNSSTRYMYSEVKIRFDDFVVEEHVYYVGYKLENLFADTGGLAGLFMGCSLLSFVEIFYFCFKACVKKFQRKKIAHKNVLTKSSDKDFLESLQHINENVYIVRDPLYRKIPEQLKV